MIEVDTQVLLYSGETLNNHQVFYYHCREEVLNQIRESLISMFPDYRDISYIINVLIKDVYFEYGIKERFVDEAEFTFSKMFPEANLSGININELYYNRKYIIKGGFESFFYFYFFVYLLRIFIKGCKDIEYYIRQLPDKELYYSFIDKSLPFSSKDMFIFGKGPLDMWGFRIGDKVG